MVIDVGTAATGLLEARFTLKPELGAGTLSVTVPVELPPPATAVGVSARAVGKGGGVMVSEPLAELPPAEAVIFAVPVVATAFVVTVNTPEDWPAGIATVLGTVTLVLSDFSVHLRPPVGALAVRVTVPVDVFPPTTLDGEKETLESPGDWIDNVAVALLPPAVAVRRTDVFADTELVAMVTVAEVLPLGTTTLAGRLALLLLLFRGTVNPPAGALLPKVTVPVAFAPPRTLEGETVKLVATGGWIVSTAVEFLPLAVAVNVAVVLTATGAVVMVSVAAIEPLGMITLAGKEAAELLLFNEMVVPPDRALAESVIVPVDVLPPCRDVGERANDLTDCAEVTVEPTNMTRSPRRMRRFKPCFISH